MNTNDRRSGVTEAQNAAAAAKFFLAHNQLINIDLPT
jgi:hypothetical protein